MNNFNHYRKRRPEKAFYRSVLDLRDQYNINYWSFCHRFNLDGIDPGDLLYHLDNADDPYYGLYIEYKREEI